MTGELNKKFESILKTEIDKYKNQLLQLEEENLSEKVTNMQKFLNNKENNIIVFDLLETFIDVLAFDNKQSFDEYKIMYKTREVLKNKKNSSFEEQLKQITISLDVLYSEINKVLSQSLKMISKTAHIKREINGSVNKLEKIYNLLVSKTVIDDVEVFEVFNEELNKMPLTEEEKLCVVFELTKQNAKNMNRAIEYEMLKKEIKKEKKKQKKSYTKKEVIQQEVKEEIQQEVIEYEIKEENIEIEPKNENEKIYNDALKIINAYKDIDNKKENIVNVLLQTKKSESIEDRLAYYQSIMDKEQQRYIIVSDMKYNILPNVENYKEGYIDLGRIINFYNELLEKEETKENIDDKIVSFLNSNNMFEELNDAKNLIEECDEFSKKNTKICFPEIYTLIYEARDYMNDLYTAINIYLTQDDSYNDYIEDIYMEIKNIINKLKEKYEENLMIFPTEKESLLQLGKSFYGDDPNCIYVFLHDEKVAPQIEKDIQNDENLSDKTYISVLQKLKERMTCDEKAWNGDHKAKNSSNYSSTFLKDHHVKSIKNNESRIFYSKFPSTIGEIDGKKSPKIVLIYSVGYGKSDKMAKSDINDEALKRCFDNKDEIDKVKKMINTKWENLSESERKLKVQELQDYLDLQYIKLGHFIKECDFEKNMKGNKINE